MSADAHISTAWQVGREAAPRLGLILTGGTIGSEFGRDNVVRLPTGAESGRLTKAIELWAQSSGDDLEIQISRPINKLSENMLPTDWLVLAQDVERLVASGVEHFLILHGTDTMAQAAAALSFLCAHLPATMCLTGSNLPPNQYGSDAPTNISGSLASLSNLTPGVYLTFAGLPGGTTDIHLGTRVRKMQASGRAYSSINRSLVGRVGRNGEFEVVDPYRRSDIATGNAKGGGVDPRVFLMRQYPGLDWDMLRSSLRPDRCRGVIVELYPSMTGPSGTDSGTDLIEFVKRTTDSGIFIGTAVSRAPEGQLNWYESALAIQDAGAVILGDMLPEVAAVKLMWLLGRSTEFTREELEEQMLLPIAAEISPLPHG